MIETRQHPRLRCFDIAHARSLSMTPSLGRATCQNTRDRVLRMTGDGIIIPSFPGSTFVTLPHNARPAKLVHPLRQQFRDVADLKAASLRISCLLYTSPSPR